MTQVWQFADELLRRIIAKRDQFDHGLQAVIQQGIDQGKDYYEYGKSFRPLEQQMAADLAANDGSKDAAERAKIQQSAQANADDLRGRLEFTKGLSDVAVWAMKR